MSIKLVEKQVARNTREISVSFNVGILNLKVIR